MLTDVVCFCSCFQLQLRLHYKRTSKQASDEDWREISYVRVSCHYVNKQRIRYGSPVWSYILYLKNNIFSNSNFFFYITHVAPHSSIFQNVAERNLFDLKCQYFWTNRTLFISTSFHCSSWQFQLISVYIYICCYAKTVRKMNYFRHTVQI